MHRIAGLVVTATTCLSLLVAAARADWDADTFRAEDTLQIRTLEADGDEHWSTLWLVVVDGQVYVRLGSRAAGRIERHANAPLVQVRIAGQEFQRVRTEPAPEMAEAVAAAMSEKYWSDVFVHLLPHPLTLRLVPESPGQPGAGA